MDEATTPAEDPHKHRENMSQIPFRKVLDNLPIAIYVTDAAMRSAGASAYLTKTEAFESLTACIRSEAQAARVMK